MKEKKKRMNRRLTNSKPTVVDEQSFIFVKDNSHFVKIWVKEILYIKAIENYTQIITTERTHTVLMRLMTVEKQLPPSVFVRANRSYIVNIAQIDAISKTEIIINNHKIVLTRTYSDFIFESYIKRYMIYKE
jgi:DNA-binding LytR/AlgR family response regulator